MMWRTSLAVVALVAVVSGEVKAGSLLAVPGVDRAKAPPPPPPDRAVPRLGLVGQRLRAPQTKMSQAGISLAISARLTFDLTYERTAYAPLMPHDHDDGILTGVRIGF